MIGGPHQGKKATYLHPTHAILCEDGKVQSSSFSRVMRTKLHPTCDLQIIHVHPFDLHDSNNPSDLECMFFFFFYLFYC